MDRVVGTIEFFDVNKGYGFVKGPNGEKVFIHAADIEVGRMFPGFKRGDTINFTMDTNKHGNIARNVGLKDIAKKPEKKNKKQDPEPDVENTEPEE